MYNIKGPSKIVAKTTRRGFGQNLDTYRDFNKHKGHQNDHELNSSPKPVFQKKNGGYYRHEEIITPQHAEIIKFISESWLSCTDDNLSIDECGNPESIKSVVYYEDEPCPLQLRDFKPFDLESWWGRRLYKIITSSVNSKC